MIRETMDRMPRNIRLVIENLRKNCKNEITSKSETRSRADWYTQGLRDASFITETERQALFIYIVS